MTWLSGPAVWIGGIVAAAFAAVFAAWLMLFLQFLPPPQQVWLRITNAFKSRPPLSETRFRLVVCWLKNDHSGRDTGTVAEAFTGIEGIELVREDSVVSRTVLARLGTTACLLSSNTSARLLRSQDCSAVKDGLRLDVRSERGTVRSTLRSSCREKMPGKGTASVPGGPTSATGCRSSFRDWSCRLSRNMLSRRSPLLGRGKY